MGILTMSDMSNYRDKVTNFGKLATSAENEKNYEAAYDYYTKALELFMHIIKCKHSFIKIIG